MSVPLLIIAGTSLLFVLALVLFISTAVRSARESRRRGWEDSLPTGESGAGQGPLDTSLEGLKVEVLEDAPSAALLTPLRTGNWTPPAEPAPLENLESASLAGRIADFVPAPDIAEPAFAVPTYASWEVEGGTPASAMPSEPVAPAIPVAEDAIVTEPVDEFGAEIAALLPEVDMQTPDAEPSSVPREEAPVVPAWVPPAVEVAAPVTEVAADSAPEVTPVPVPEPVAVPEPEPVPVPEPEPAVVLTSAFTPEPALHPEPVTVPVPGSVSEPEPEYVPVIPAPGTDAPVEDEAQFWNAEMAEQSSRSVPVASAPVVAPRPEVKVAPPQPVVPESKLTPAVEPPSAAPRPRVHVHVAQDAPARESRPQVSGVTLVMNAERPERASVDPQLVMAAPVEMWFGDSRVGVKAGTATFDRFRKYADALLDELRGSRGQAG